MTVHFSKKSKLITNLERVKRSLNSMKVEWMLYAGTAANLYGSGRSIRDIDILVSNNERRISKKLGISFENKLLKFRSCNIKVRLARINKIEISRSPRIIVGNKSYVFSIDSEMMKRKKQLKLFGVTVPVISVEDNIAFKCLLQRGSEDDKYDLKDAKNMVLRNRIDFDYLMNRVNTLGARSRIIPALEKILF